MKFVFPGENNEPDAVSAFSKIVPYTVIFDDFKRFPPTAATVSSALLLGICGLPDTIFRNTVDMALADSSFAWLETTESRLSCFFNKTIVNVGGDLVKLVPSRVSTEVDARLAYDTNGIIRKVHDLLRLYNEIDVPHYRLLFQNPCNLGIESARLLESEGIQTHMTFVYRRNTQDSVITQRQQKVSRFLKRKSMEKVTADASETIDYTHQLKDLHNHIEASIKKRSQELELKEKELQSLSLDLEKKSKTFEAEKSKAGDLKKFTEECTRELRSKKNQLTEKLDFLTRINGELELKNKQLELVKAKLNRCCNEVHQFQERKRKLEDETARKKKELSLVVNQIEESGKQLATVDEQLELQRKLLEIRSLELVSTDMELSPVRESIMVSNCKSSSEMEERATEINAAETEASELNVRSNLLREEVEGKEKELELLKNQIESEEKKLLQRKREMEESGQQLAAKEMELGCVRESIKLSSSELQLKEKMIEQQSHELGVMHNQRESIRLLIQELSEQLDSKSKELKGIQRAILKKRLRQMSSVLVNHEKQPAAEPINDTAQPNAAETEPCIEDLLTQHELPAPLTRDEVSSGFRDLPNPAEFVLEEVQERISEDLALQDSVLEILVLFFEELAKIRRSDDPQLELKATQVATLWKGNINIEAPKSSLEALTFLLFIVAYGLKKLINEEETALLASSIAHFKQAPRLFNNPEIQNSVKVLIKKSHYIPAVRLICLFKLDKEFSPSDLLKEEIINLRRSSALKKRPNEASQAKVKDAGRLIAILELVADYKLEISLPGDLIAKLMIQRENSPALVN